MSSTRFEHLDILKRSGLINSKELARQSGLEINTSNKYVHFAIKDGHKILTHHKKGIKTCFYEYISGPATEHETGNRLERILQECEDVKRKEIAKWGLSEGSEYIQAINRQISNLKMKIETQKKGG